MYEVVIPMQFLQPERYGPEELFCSELVTKRQLHNATPHRQNAHKQWADPSPLKLPHKPAQYTGTHWDAEAVS